MGSSHPSPQMSFSSDHADEIVKLRAEKDRLQRLLEDSRLVCDSQSDQLTRLRMNTLFKRMPAMQDASSQVDQSSCILLENTDNPSETAVVESFEPQAKTLEHCCSFPECLLSSARTISDLRQRLADHEHTITLLQGENSTIDEYVSFYLKQRQRLENRYATKELYMRQLYSAYTRCQLLIANFQRLVRALQPHQWGLRSAPPAEQTTTSISERPFGNGQVTVNKGALDELMQLADNCSPSHITCECAEDWQKPGTNECKPICICQYCKGALYRI